MSGVEVASLPSNILEESKVVSVESSQNEKCTSPFPENVDDNIEKDGKRSPVSDEHAPVPTRNPWAKLKSQDQGTNPGHTYS